LTQYDTKEFVYDRLHEIIQSQALVAVKNKIIEERIKQVVHAANGVFRWVYLAVKNVRNGLENGDSLISCYMRSKNCLAKWWIFILTCYYLSIQVTRVIKRMPSFILAWPRVLTHMIMTFVIGIDISGYVSNRLDHHAE